MSSLAWVAFAVGSAVALARWRGRRGSRADRERQARLAAELPVALDLLAACLLAGSTPESAARAVADAVGGPLGERLRRVVAISRLGADPSQSWLAIGDEPGLAQLGRSMARAVAGGSQPAAEVSRIADDLRAQQRWALTAAAHRVGVKAVAPLGLCFLPAFVLLGVVPVVAGMVRGAWG